MVDDEPAVRATTAAYLAAEGHAVVQAAGGREGLAALREGSFDVVLTDRAMPDMGGDQLAQAVKAEVPGLPVVLLTGFGGFMAAEKERPAGVDAVLGKPVTLAQLRETLAAVTQR